MCVCPDLGPEELHPVDGNNLHPALKDLPSPTNNAADPTPEAADDEHEEEEANADTQPPTVNKRRGSDVSEERKEPMSLLENTEDRQHETNCEEPASEDEATTNFQLEEGFSGDLENPSIDENSD